MNYNQLDKEAMFYAKALLQENTEAFTYAENLLKQNSGAYVTTRFILEMMKQSYEAGYNNRQIRDIDDLWRSYNF